MNVKPGDLAIIKCKQTVYDGRIVEVLCKPPRGIFVLPDGYPARYENDEPSWLVKFVGGPAVVQIGYGGVASSTRVSWYGVGADKCLFPLPGVPDEEEERIAVTVSDVSDRG